MLSTHIWGEPFCKPYRGRRPTAVAKWESNIAEATADWPLILGPCRLGVTFFLPLDKYAAPGSMGPDLDNLLKRLLDALKTTVFRPPSDDSYVVELRAAKFQAGTMADAGLHLRIEIIEGQGQ
jgi:Holliday junction resolvase RusA-like endonuclease